MANKSSPLYNYSKRKFISWRRENKKFDTHIPVLFPRKQIAKEFLTDSEELKQKVCPYIRKASKIKAKDEVLQAVEDVADITLKIPISKVATIALDALNLACRYL